MCVRNGNSTKTQLKSGHTSAAKVKQNEKQHQEQQQQQQQ